MSIAAMVWALTEAPVKKIEQLVLVQMAKAAKDDELLSFLAEETIANLTGFSIRSVRDALKTLAEIGLITDTGERRGATGRVKAYRLEVGNPAPRAALNAAIHDSQSGNPRQVIRQELPVDKGLIGEGGGSARARVKRSPAAPLPPAEERIAVALRDLTDKGWPKRIAQGKLKRWAARMPTYTAEQLALTVEGYLLEDGVEKASRRRVET